MPGLFVRLLLPSLVPLLLLAGCTGGATPVATPDPTSTSTATASATANVVDRPTPEEIVDDPEAQLVEVHAAPGDPDQRVALWRLCADESCARRKQVVVFTDDGFRTRTVADARWDNAFVRISEDGQVVVIDYRARLRMDVVRPDGSVTPVEMSRERSPVAAGEVVAGVLHRAGRQLFWATDPSTATAHLVPVPDGTHQILQTTSGQLRALIEPQSYAWSDDGGATWTRVFDGLSRNFLTDFVASTDDVHVVVHGGDGATLFPFSQIRQLQERGDWSLIEQPAALRAYVGPTAVLPDGRFLASVQSWSDNKLSGKEPKGTPPGIYVSDGEDWSTYERVVSGRPFRTPRPFEPMVTDIEVNADGALITAIGPDQTTAWTSKDLGATWLEMRVR